MNVLLLTAAIASALAAAPKETNRTDLLLFELHSFTESVQINRGSEEKEDLPRLNFSGHAYVVVQNQMNYSFYVGDYYLAPGEKISIGLWGQGPSGSSSGNINHSGVFYNLERYRFGVYENPQNDVHLTCTVDSNELGTINSKIYQKRDYYNLLSYNCSSFACELWNIASGESLSAGWINTPDYLRYNMMNYSSYTYSTIFNIGNSSTFCYYDTANSQMVVIY